MGLPEASQLETTQTAQEDIPTSDEPVEYPVPPLIEELEEQMADTQQIGKEVVIVESPIVDKAIEGAAVETLAAVAQKTEKVVDLIDEASQPEDFLYLICSRYHDSSHFCSIRVKSIFIITSHI